MVWGWPDRCARARRWIDAAATFDQARLVRHQAFGASRVRFVHLEPASVVWVMGVDAQIEDDVGVGAAVLFRSGTDEPQEVATARCSIRLPYCFGLLGFRELGAIFAAAAKIGRRPDLVFYDGNGVLHPRSFGAASQLGLYLDVPTIGVSKNVKPAQTTRGTRGDLELIEPGRGGYLTTRSGVKPVCVSPGHRIDLDSSLRLVLQWSRMRVPEPIRYADQHARCAMRDGGPGRGSGLAS